MGKVDCDSEKMLAGRFGVNSFPTIKVWDYGAKTDSGARPYQGERTASGITEYGANLAEKADIEPDVFELFKQGVYDNECKGTVICIINFLPNIYDSNAAEREGYLKMIMEVAKK